MFRARRLKAIAEANQPVFESAAGTQWWLAEVAAKDEAPVSASKAAPVPVPQQRQAAPAEIAQKSQIVDAPEPKPEAETYAYAFANEKAQNEKSDAGSGERLSWDAQNCCFVRTA